LADWIISLMPPHVHYVEPYFGGGSVLLNKPCEGVSEVVNDLNYDLTNFWSVLKDETLFQRFCRRVESTPFSEVEFGKAAKGIRLCDHGEDVSEAVRFFIRCRQSRSGQFKSFATMSRTRTRRNMNEQASAWLNAIEGLPAVHERLKRVVILNHDALDVIQEQDGEQTCFYLDPPYLHSTRESTDVYAHEMTEAQHMTLLKVLEDIKGKFLLSGYPSALYQCFEDCNPHWKRHEFEIVNNASGKKVKDVKTECVWTNF
jgi:DNA adenine methylase